MSLLQGLKNQISTVFKHAPVSDPSVPGIYHFERQEGPNKSRIHLRIEADGNGLLIVNAARMYHLNPTAAFMAHLVLKEISLDQAVSILHRRYQVPKDQAFVDFHQVYLQVQELICPEGACPICDLELETIAPFSKKPSAPYRMDLALTYRCNNNCSHCYNARSRQFPELDTNHWKKILDKCWEIGIPHIVFTGGEPTLRADLPQLIAHAELNGQITGINTNGRRLKDKAYLQELADAGLDHIQVTLESHLPSVHDYLVAAPGAWMDTTTGIRNALQVKGLYLMTNTTLLQANTPSMEGTLEFLADLGVPTVGLNALIYSGRGQTVGTGLPEESLKPLLEVAQHITSSFQQRLIWYTPTQYCHFDPVQMNLGVKGCTAALYNMCVEPDGAVIPCQSYYQPLGKLLETPWDAIWNHPLALSLRERQDIPAGCTDCALLSECGGGCPLYRQITQGTDDHLSQRLPLKTMEV